MGGLNYWRIDHNFIYIFLYDGCARRSSGDEIIGVDTDRDEPVSCFIVWLPIFWRHESVGQAIQVCSDGDEFLSQKLKSAWMTQMTPDMYL
jgi:hypothetical protein